MTNDPRFHPPEVMLLAAGLGLRMRPLTETRPKPLIPVAGRTLLDRAIDLAAAEGCSRFVVNAHYQAEQLQAHIEARAAGSPLRFRLSLEPLLLGTGGAVKQALPLLDGDPILVMNTDAFWPAEADQPIGRMVARHAAGGVDIVLLCAQPHRALGFRRSHDFCLDPRGRITRDSGQPVIYGGVALLGRAVIETTPGEKFSLYPLFEAALERGTLAGIVLDAPWFHVGDPAALAEAEASLASMAG